MGQFHDMKVAKYVFYVIVFIVLTIVTQIGGLAICLGLIVSKYLKFQFNKLVLCITFYLVIALVITPYVAPWFGRETIQNSSVVKPTNYLTILLNRNYVTPELNKVLKTTAKKLDEGVEIRYLDANFPFFVGFPLLPHLSHNDGKKIDISLMYVDEADDYTNLKPSQSGYGVFVTPKPNEFNQTLACKREGYWQYDFPKYLTFGSTNEELRFSKYYTKKLVDALLTNSAISKMFIEKHLIDRMKLSDSRIRFHGCRAVRHDDHIHIQIK